MDESFDLFGGTSGTWRKRLEHIIQTMREISRQRDPQAMVQTYATRIRRYLPMDRMLSLSRRGVEPPKYLVARDSNEEEELNPWTQRHQLPVLEGGLLGRLRDSNDAHLIDDLEVEPDDPGAEYLRGYRSLLALPVFNGGEAINLVVLLRREPHAFDPEIVPQLAWTTSLFGRATHNLVLSNEVQQAHDELDREMKAIADIQRSLLPAELPEIPHLDLATHYQPAARAGGDYYDLLPFEDGRWGLLIADVAGHGSPAAVLMAITHTLAHTRPAECRTAPCLLNYVNRHLTSRYTLETGTFVTAFFALYEPETRELRYANAGHNPPRLKRCSDGSLFSLDGDSGLPLGIMADAQYRESSITLTPGDQIIFFTDGITEGRDERGEMFGIERLDRVLHDCRLTSQGMIDTVLEELGRFAGRREADDDRTLLVARATP
jgi:sigma-B regulation protein RsbU (phosphoserine phosphatase)